MFLPNTINNAHETVEMPISFHEGKLSKYLEAATGCSMKKGILKFRKIHTCTTVSF